MPRFWSPLCIACVLILSAEINVEIAKADQFDSIRRQITEGLKEQNVAGLAVAVAKDGEIIWEEGFGFANLEKQTPTTENTMFSLASISKPMTATALMMLVEQGKLDLAKPVNDYLGDAKIRAFLGDAKDATVQSVANHASGLPLHYQFFLANQPHQRPSMEITIQRYGILVQPPGEGFVYSNLGYGILDHIVSRTSGKEFADFLREEIFLPLGMKHASIDVAPDLKGHEAERYKNDLTVIPFYDFDHPGASAVFCSAHDLATFGMFHLKQLSAEKQKLLSNRSIDEMQKPTRKIAGGKHDAHYGLGWKMTNQYGTKFFGHSGGMGGVHTLLTMAPEEGLVVVVLTNTQRPLFREVSTAILEILLPDYRENLKKAVALKKKTDSPDSNPLKSQPGLVGTWQGVIDTYEGDRQAVLEITNDGQMSLAIDSEPSQLFTKVHIGQGYLYGKTMGDLKTEDDNRQNYLLDTRLKLRGDHLNGRITSRLLPGTGKLIGNGLSHWISLERAE